MILLGFIFLAVAVCSVIAGVPYVYARANSRQGRPLSYGLWSGMRNFEVMMSFNRVEWSLFGLVVLTLISSSCLAIFLLTPWDTMA